MFYSSKSCSTTASIKGGQLNLPRRGYAELHDSEIPEIPVMFSGEKGAFQARMTFKNSSGAGGWLERKEKNQKENKAQKLVGIHNP